VLHSSFICPQRLCLRHTTRLPTVQVRREIDTIPFDLNQYRTIPIETRDPYTLLPKVQTYTAEVTNQVQRALQDAESGDNPISLYYPSARLTWGQKAIITLTNQNWKLID